MKTIRLKRVADINRRVLSESTDPATVLRYVDISAVGAGRLRTEPQSIPFSHAPSRARRLVAPGDTIVSTVRTYLRAIWPVSDEMADVVVSTGFAVITPIEVDPRFLGWALQSPSFVEAVVAASTGVSYPAISPSALGDLEIPLPNSEEQALIAEFLTATVRQIDELTERRLRMAALILERVSALTERAIWLDRDGHPRPATTLRRLAKRIDVGIAEAATHAYRDDGVPLLRSTNIRRGELDVSDILYIDPAFAQQRLTKTIRAGDLLTVRTGNVGVTAVVPPELDGSQCFTQLITTPVPGVSSDFLSMALNSQRTTEYFSLTGWGSAQANISVPTLAAAPVPDVPFEEQHRIVKDLSEQLATLRKLAAVTSRQTLLLGERRDALIDAATSGHLGVAGAIAAGAS